MRKLSNVLLWSSEKSSAEEAFPLLKAMSHLTAVAKTPYHVLGVPSYAGAAMIRAAYLKRIAVLGAYRFNPTTQPREWEAVNELLNEVHDAYARLCPQNQEHNSFGPNKDEASTFRKVTAA